MSPHVTHCPPIVTPLSLYCHPLSPIIPHHHPLTPLSSHRHPLSPPLSPHCPPMSPPRPPIVTHCHPHPSRVRIPMGDCSCGFLGGAFGVNFVTPTLLVSLCYPDGGTWGQAPCHPTVTPLSPHCHPLSPHCHPPPPLARNPSGGLWLWGFGAASLGPFVTPRHPAATTPGRSPWAPSAG